MCPPERAEAMPAREVTMIDSIKNSHAESINVQTSTVRQTPDQAGSFEQVLGQGAGVLLEAASGVVGVLPGGGILSAAVRATGEAVGQSSTAPGWGEDPRTPSTTPIDSPVGSGGGSGGEMDDLRAMQEEGMRTNMELLEIQQEVSRETRVFSTLSNVLKARHDTARNAIGNIR